MPDEDLPKKLEKLKHAYGLEYEMVRATAAFEHALLRPLFILNGGALVLYLGLFGALSSKTNYTIDFSLGKIAVWMWIAGLVLATVAAFLGARSQYEFRHCRGREVDAEEIKLELQTDRLKKRDAKPPRIPL